MVKVFAPGLSLDASGTIGEAITFSKWKGRHYIRERVIPSNPQSGLQTGFRSMFKFLAENWAAMTAAQKASFNDLADAIAVSNFNAFVQFNQKRWRSYRTPSKETPAAEAGSLGAWDGSTPTATGGVASITINYQLTTANDNWGMVLYRYLTPGSDKVLSNVIACVLLEDTDAHTYVDSPLTAGTYYYSARLFTDDGVFGGAFGDISAAAT